MRHVLSITESSVFDESVKDESTSRNYDIQVNLRRYIVTAESINSEWQIFGSNELMNKLAELMEYGAVEVQSLSEMKKDGNGDDDGEEKEDVYESTAVNSMGLKMHYKSGPVKQYDRSREKVESDYSTCKYPQSSQLLDLIRCSITVETVKQLFELLKCLLDYGKECEQIMHDNTGISWSFAESPVFYCCSRIKHQRISIFIPIYEKIYFLV